MQRRAKRSLADVTMTRPLPAGKMKAGVEVFWLVIRLVQVLQGTNQHLRYFDDMAYHTAR